MGCTVSIPGGVANDRASEASTDLIEDAIRDLDDLALFPDGLRLTGGHRLWAREVRNSLSGRLCQRLSALV